MRVLFIGGNGNISAACGRSCLERGVTSASAYQIDETNRTMDRYIAAWRNACSAGRQGGVGGEAS